MSKPKLLWVGDIVAMTGFARVTENVLPYFKDKYEIHVLGCNWHGDHTPLSQEYFLYPASNRFQPAPFGEDKIREMVERIKPDIVFTINDSWIINEQWRRIQDLRDQLKFKFVGYYPMDSYEWYGGLLDTMNEWDVAICYTEFGAHETIRAGCKVPISVVPHGMTPEQFHPKDKLECRKALNLNPDDFIVFNGNRNQFRKRMDITISAFAKFAKDKPDAKLYMHMGLKDQGWDIMPLFHREMTRQGLDPNNRIIMSAPTHNGPNVPVDVLNTIYNAVDVGVNTCKGEGWGLVNFEHAACRVAQIVPDHTSCKEIFEGTGEMIRCLHNDVDTNFGRILPCPDDNHLAEILDKYYKDRTLLNQVAENCYQRVTNECFHWSTIAGQFDELFQETLGTVEKPVQIRKPKGTKTKKKTS
ncbi:MAG: glycosyltransferase family 4 protein [Flavobacteriaceae bacterium]